MCDLPEYVPELLSKIANAEGFANDYMVKVKPGCNQGDGFLGDLRSITITGSHVTNAEPAELHLVCKLAPANAARRQGFDSITLFKREALMYDTILPLLREIELEKGLADGERYTAYPKCYEIVADEAKDHFAIIMEDVRARGYTMWDRSQPIPMEYVKRLLLQLARMHAISFALKDQRPDVYEKFKAVNDVVVDFITTDTMATVIEASYARCLAAVTSDKHVQMVNDVAANSESYYKECVSEEFVGEQQAITHGDCWINNLLFHKQASAPVDICLVDWQMSRFGSVINDLYYIMFTSIDHTTLRNEFYSIMDYYYDALSNAIRRLGSDPNTLYSYDVFTKDVKKYAKYGLLMALVITQLLVVDQTDFNNLDEISQKTDGSADFVQSIKGNTEIKYKQRIRDILDTFLQLDLYWQ